MQITIVSTYTVSFMFYLVSRLCLISRSSYIWLNNQAFFFLYNVLELSILLLQLQSLTDSPYAHIMRMLKYGMQKKRRKERQKTRAKYRDCILMHTVHRISNCWVNCLCIFSSIMHCYGVLSDTSWVKWRKCAHFVTTEMLAVENGWTDRCQRMCLLIWNHFFFHSCWFFCAVSWSTQHQANKTHSLIDNSKCHAMKNIVSERASSAEKKSIIWLKYVIS